MLVKTILNKVQKFKSFGGIVETEITSETPEGSELRTEILVPCCLKRSSH